jgi:uncharacterized membrane protein YfcA
LICGECNSAYAPPDDLTGKVETLAGLCPDCGTEPKFRRLGRAAIDGVIAGAIPVELLLLLMFLENWLKALIYPVLIALICGAIYAITTRSKIVTYQNERERRYSTLWHRIFFGIIGFGIGIGAFFLFLDVAFR